MTEPADTISLAESFLKASLADCEAFRTWAGAADQAEALERIYYDGLPEPAHGAEEHSLAELQNYRPYAVIYTAEALGFQKLRVGAEAWQASGRLILRLYQDAPAGADSQPSADANRVFKNCLGAIISGLCDLCGQAGYLCFNAIRVDEGPYWGQPDDLPSHGVWLGAQLSIDWEGI